MHQDSQIKMILSSIYRSLIIYEEFLWSEEILFDHNLVPAIYGDKIDVPMTEITISILKYEGRNITISGEGVLFQ